MNKRTFTTRVIVFPVLAWIAVGMGVLTIGTTIVDPANSVRHRAVAQALRSNDPTECRMALAKIDPGRINECGIR